MAGADFCYPIMRLNFWRKWRKFGVNPLLHAQKIKQFQGFAVSLSTYRPWELCIFITRNVGLCRDINVLVFTYSTYLYKDIHRSTGKNGKFYRKLSDLFSQAGCNFTKRLLHRVEIGMGIYIQRYTDIRMTHQILQTLHINAALLHIRAECMP